MSHEQTAKQLMDALPSSKRSRGQPITRWQNYVEDLAWLRLGVSPAELPLVAGDRDVGAAAPATLEGQPDKRKFTEVIQCFPRK